MFRRIAGIFILLTCLFSVNSQSQCIVINEILIDGAGGCDGSCSPNTEEWIELYNTCNSPVDISCFVVGDGDWSVRIPNGTVIPGFGHFTIGSSNSGIPIDLNIGSCACTTGGGQVGVFTNGSEQLILLNELSEVVDAIIWGGGQLPATISNTAAGCPSVSASFANSGSINFEDLPLDANDGGCTYARTCDGSDTWELRCGSEITGQSSNGETPLVDFDASSSNICTGECISFTDLSDGDVLTWSWEFEGSTNGSSNLEDPSAICYSNAGIYDVTLTVTTSCGSGTYTAVNFIAVSDAEIPTISADVIEICEGETALLSTTSTSSIQWYIGTQPINGATLNTLEVTQAGSYSLVAGSGNCINTSDPITIDVSPFTLPIISSGNELDLCTGEIAIINLNTSYPIMQWYDQFGLIPGETNSSLTVDYSGSFYCEVSNGTCSAQSNSIDINFFALPLGSINPLGPISLCPLSTADLEVTGTYATIEWTKDGEALTEGSSTITVDLPGVYQAILYNQAGCFVLTNSVVVSILSVPNLAISSENNSTTLCPNDLLTLSASSGFSSYNWVFENQNVSNSTSIEIDEGGSYTVEGTTAENCHVISEITITDVQAPVVSISPGNTVTTCFETIDLTVTAANSSYQWFLNSTEVVGSTSAVLTISAPGSYTAQATNNFGCSAISEATLVTFITAPELSIISPLPTCEGNTVVLSVDGTPQSVVWNTGSTEASLPISSSGIYVATAAYANGCISTGEIEYTFLPTPYLEYTIASEATCFEGSILDIETNGILSWNDPYTTANIDSTQLFVEMKKKKTLTITSSISDCSTSESISLTIDCSSLYIPNSFTPNRDGVNDFFQVVGEGISEYEFIVFNRWGAEVFRTNDVAARWDGGFDEYYVPDGVYYYIVKALDINGQPVLSDIDQLGTITIIR